MNWWLIAALIVFLIIIFKFKEIRHKFGLIVIVVLVLFLVASFGQLYTKNHLDLKSFDGIVDAGKIYFSWLGAVAHNVVKVSTFAVKQDWNAVDTNSTQKVEK